MNKEHVIARAKNAGLSQSKIGFLLRVVGVGGVASILDRVPTATKAGYAVRYKDNDPAALTFNPFPGVPARKQARPEPVDPFPGVQVAADQPQDPDFLGPFPSMEDVLERRQRQAAKQAAAEREARAAEIARRKRLYAQSEEMAKKIFPST